MPTFDSGRGASIGGFNVRSRRASDLTGFRFSDDRAAPTSANDMVLYRRAGALFFWNGTSEFSVNVLLSGTGSTVTQITSITTGVTLNSVKGQITTVSTTLAAAAEAEFVVTNSTVLATSAVIVNLASTASAGVPIAWVSRVAAGSFTIMISNLDAALALNNTLVINFVVLP